MRIGKKLMNLRLEKDWKQEAVAKLVGMSQSNYSNIELNKQDVTWEQIEHFAKVFETTPMNLLPIESPVINSNNQQGGSVNNYQQYTGSENEVEILRALVQNQEKVISNLEEKVMQLEQLIKAMNAPQSP